MQFSSSSEFRIYRLFKNVFEQQLVRGRILRSLYVWLGFKLFEGLRPCTSAEVSLRVRRER